MLLDLDQEYSSMLAQLVNNKMALDIEQ